MSFRRNKKFYFVLAVVLGVVAVVCAWWFYAASGPEAPPAATSAFALRDGAINDVEWEGDWREARIVPAGSHTIDLGAIPAGGALRIGTAPRQLFQRAPHVFVLAGDVVVTKFDVREPKTWTDYRVALAAYGGDGAPCRVVIVSDVDVYVSHCELVPIASGQPNVVLFLVDTMRRDHLGCYGYARDTSPNMDGLAGDGVRLNGMISQSSWTRPAVASLLTSTYPSVHRANDRADILRQDLPTVAEAFRDAGYVTEGFMSNPSCLPAWGFGRGFGRYLDIDSYTVNPGKDADVVDAVLAALDDVAGRPWFFYVHAIGPHDPYDPPAPYDRMFTTDTASLSQEEANHANARDRYDGEIAFTDAQIGRLIAALRAKGMYDNTWFVVLSDHGEEFWEHGGEGHGTTLYDELIRIPCIVKPPHPGESGVVVDGVCEIVDVAPTLIDRTGLTIPPTFQGHSLAGFLSGGTLPAHLAYSSLYLEKHSQYGARSDGLKYINNIAAGSESWYDLAADPGEHAALAAMPSEGAALVQYASRIAASGNAGLHILVTGSLLEEHTIEGTIAGKGMGDISLRYLANNGEVHRTDDGVTFRITTSVGQGAGIGLAEWHEIGAEQNHANVHVEAKPDEPLRITVNLDGAPAPESAVFVGPAMTPRALQDTVLEPVELVAGSEQFDPVALPRRLAVYVWYVPGPETVADEDLDPGMRDALKALGYL